MTVFKFFGGESKIICGFSTVQRLATLTPEVSSEIERSDIHFFLQRFLFNCIEIVVLFAWVLQFPPPAPSHSEHT